MPVQRVVGGVEIEDDLCRRRRMRLDKEVDEHALDLRCVITDLVVTRRLRPAQLQPVEGRFAGQRRAIRAPRFELAGQDRHDRVVAQRVMVDQILVTECQAKHPLPNQGRHRVLDQLGHALVGETAGKPLDQPDRPVGGAEQQRAGIRSHRAAVKRGHYRAPCDRYKAKQIRATLCLHRDSPCSCDKPFSQHDFLRSRAPMHLPL